MDMASTDSVQRTERCAADGG